MKRILHAVIVAAGFSALKKQFMSGVRRLPSIIIIRLVKLLACGIVYL